MQAISKELFTKVLLIVFHLAGPLLTAGAADTVSLVEAGRARTVIVTADQPAPAVRLGALELQHWLREISGADVPILTESATIQPGITPIYLGATAAAAGGPALNGLEYQVAVTPERILLRGNDAQQSKGDVLDYGLMTRRQASGVTVQVPRQHELQGTLRAVYDFLENELGVRFYGPRDSSVCHPETSEVAVSPCAVVRAPTFQHFTASFTIDWPLISGMYGKPTSEESLLFQRRMRMGGIPWYNNHTMQAYKKRFAKELNDPLFEADHPEYFPPEGGSAHQLCYSSEALVEQVARDAVAYFSGKPLPGIDLPSGSDYFPIVPEDAGHFCSCERCQAQLRSSEDKCIRWDGLPMFNNGQASNYWFGFVNKVARKVAETYPDKYIATLAYEQYYWEPDFPLEPNISITPCMHARFGMCPTMTRNEFDHYNFYQERRRAGRLGPVFLWNYYCFPEESCVIRGEKCFPGFCGRHTGKLMQRYAADGVSGIFFCGIGEQVDFLLIAKSMNNADYDIEATLAEFFDLYFGAAAGPMADFYNLIESRYFNPEFYAAHRIEGHQTQKIAWELLATPEVMTTLRQSIEAAKQLADTPETRQHVAEWETGVCEYMEAGYREYQQKLKQLKTTAPHSAVAADYIENVDVNASWQHEVSAYTLVSGFNMIEAEKGVLGSREAALSVAGNAERPWNGLAAGSWVEFDLGAVYSLAEIRIWNYQQNDNPDAVDRGMRDIEITASPKLDLSDWQTIYVGRLPRAQAHGPSPVSAVVPVHRPVRYIRISTRGGRHEGNYGDEYYSSLGQVRFYGRKLAGQQ